MGAVATLPLAEAPVAEGHLALLIMVGLIALMLPGLIRRWRRQKKPASGLKQARERVDDAVRNDRMRRSADQALADLLETGREINAQIDTKIRILNKLVKDADNEARRLEKLLGVSREALPDPASSSGKERSETADEGRAPSSAAEPAGGASERRRRSALNERIAALREEGRSPAEIARQTRLSLSEVNMVLHLLAAGKRD